MTLNRASYPLGNFGLNLLGFRKERAFPPEEMRKGKKEKEEERYNKKENKKEEKEEKQWKRRIAIKLTD